MPRVIGADQRRLTERAAWCPDNSVNNGIQADTQTNRQAGGPVQTRAGRTRGDFTRYRTGTTEVKEN